jgi:hypothetical protein
VSVSSLKSRGRRQERVEFLSRHLHAEKATTYFHVHGFCLSDCTIIFLLSGHLLRQILTDSRKSLRQKVKLRACESGSSVRPQHDNNRARPGSTDERTISPPGLVFLPSQLEVQKPALTPQPVFLADPQCLNKTRKQAPMRTAQDNRIHRGKVTYIARVRCYTSEASHPGGSCCRLPQRHGI